VVGWLPLWVLLLALGAPAGDSSPWSGSKARRPCRLRFTADGTAITVEELDGSCRWYCGPRATIGRVFFLRPTCPPVRDQ
jgi:hypothetical protein